MFKEFHTRHLNPLRKKSLHELVHDVQGIGQFELMRRYIVSTGRLTKVIIALMFVQIFVAAIQISTVRDWVMGFFR